MKNYIHQFITNRDWDFSRINSFIEQAKKLRDYYDPHDNFFCKNKTAIVTGASSGIGRAIAKDLASRGANIVLVARNEKKLQTLMDEINHQGGLAVSFPTDVTDEKQCKTLINNTISTFGKIDLLINNAGISMRANFHEVDLSVLKKLMDTNFWGAVYCTKYALPHISRQNGSIVGISSICGITPLPGRTGYAASKHALDGFMETLRLENMERNLHVMLVHPGFTTSNIRNVALNRHGKPQIETPLDETKLMSAENVAKSVAYGIQHKKRDLILTKEGKLITWLYRRMPAMAEKLIFQEMKKEVGSPF